jgi:hypothetical protein
MSTSCASGDEILRGRTAIMRGNGWLIRSDNVSDTYKRQWLLGRIERKLLNSRLSFPYLQHQKNFVILFHFIWHFSLHSLHFLLNKTPHLTFLYGSYPFRHFRLRILNSVIPFHFVHFGNDRWLQNSSWQCAKRNVRFRFQSTINRNPKEVCSIIARKMTKILHTRKLEELSSLFPVCIHIGLETKWKKASLLSNYLLKTYFHSFKSCLVISRFNPFGLFTSVFHSHIRIKPDFSKVLERGWLIFMT